jgi:threonine dehydrogenase-like Zn-dependent dehydrogenase
VLDPADDATPARIAEITNGRGLRVAFDCVGRTTTMAQADRALGPRGRLVLVGISPDPVSVGQGIHFVRHRHTVIGHTGYQMRHLEELVELVSRGRLDVSGSVSAILPLEEVAAGVRMLHEHEGNPIRMSCVPEYSGPGLATWPFRQAFVRSRLVAETCPGVCWRWR